jgi:hypothetical protein
MPSIVRKTATSNPTGSPKITLTPDTRHDGHDKRRSRDFSQRALDVVREATERHGSDDTPQP